jgi:tRNA (guanine-N7-)-methyltransferase
MNTALSQGIQPEHTIKSFVKRSGRLTQSQQQALDNLSTKYLIDKRLEDGTFSQFFEEKLQRHYLEIGFGNGQSLLHMAQSHPFDQFLGIEVHTPGIGQLMNNLHQQTIDNVKICTKDAATLLRDDIPNQSLDGILVFFPDPWPKRKHQKRRLVQQDFIDIISQKLKTGGMFHMATDWSDYAKDVLKLLKINPHFKNMAKNDNFHFRPNYRAHTKFEKRGEKLGHQIFDIIFKYLP